MEYTEPVIADVGSFAALTQLKVFSLQSDGTFGIDPLDPNGPGLPLTNSS